MRLFVSFLTEILLLVVLGASPVCGSCCARKVLLHLVPESLPRLNDHID